MKRFALVTFACLMLSACTSANKNNKNSKPEGMPPKLLAPSVKKIWIPPVLKEGGQEWVEGHYLYRIERGTAWSN